MIYVGGFLEICFGKLWWNESVWWDSDGSDWRVNFIFLSVSHHEKVKCWATHWVLPQTFKTNTLCQPRSLRLTSSVRESTKKLNLCSQICRQHTLNFIFLQSICEKCRHNSVSDNSRVRVFLFYFIFTLMSVQT